MKKSEMSNELINQIQEVYKEQQSIRKTRDEINKKLNMSLTYHNIRDSIKELIDEAKELKEELEELNEDIKTKPKYEVDNSDYIFYLKREDSKGNIYDKEYRIQIEIVDSIFKDYSKHGNNLSSEEVIQKYSLKPEVWNLIKNRLRLYKASHILSPISLERATDGELDNYIEDAIDEHIQDKYKNKFVNTYEKKKEVDYKKKSKILANIDNTLEHIQSFLTSYEPKVLNFEVPEILNNDEIDVLFSDIHLGKMNSKDVIRRIAEMTADLKARPEKVVHLMCLGDIFENLVKGGMHIGQVEDMDGIYGFDLLMLGVQLLETMILELYKAGKEVKFYGVGGNHDRFTANKDDGFAGIGAYIVYELIRRGLQNIKVEINILKETWNILDLDDVRYIIHHGDNGVARKGINSGEKILWEHGDSNKYNIIASGDQHHLQVKNQSDKSTSLIVPAIAGKNSFDTKLGLSSDEGYIIVKRIKDKKPKITFNTL